MDYKVRWSPEAIEDVEDIASYISKDSAHYAKVVIENIIAVSRSLNRLALRGRTVPELERDKYREIFIYSYRLIYRLKENQVLIIAIIHGKRQLEDIKGRFK